MGRPSRVSPLVWLLLPLVAIGAIAVGLALAGAETGEVVREHVAAAATPEPADEGDAGLDAGPAEDPRVAPDGAILAPPAGDEYACREPALEVPRDPACEAGAPYPRCRWQLPLGRDSGGLWRTWRNTTDDHRWARPGLVSLIMAASAEYARRWPGEQVTVGDLDAAGPRHQTHDRGVDVDLYLEHAMIAQNVGGGRYPDNYAHRSASEVAMLRARVLDLAKILATCSGGRLRIYYNDPELVQTFMGWFAERGMHSDVGPAMRLHNPLHRFHFHMTVAEDLAPLPR